MADLGDGASSWPGLVGQINSTFMLIRDAFGYALPGAVFLTIGVIAKSGCDACGGFTLKQLGDAVPFDVPAWGGLLAAIAASYAAGNVMAAIVYMPISLIKYIVWLLDRHYLRCEANNGSDTDTVKVGWTKVAKGATEQVGLTAKQAKKPPSGVVIKRRVTNTTAGIVRVGTTDVQPGATVSVPFEDSLSLPPGVAIEDPPEGGWRDWLFSNPTEVTAKILEIRLKNRDLLSTLDRRETLNVMGGTMAAALLTGYFVFYVGHWGFSKIILWGGVIGLVQFVTGLSHLRRVLKAVRLANVPDPPPDPNLTKILTEVAAASSAALKKLSE
jgi:hypothetical protein